ncbi:methyltransferase domain-containing protein [Candidatus Uhrbacteria bacterium]|nr:methyltransferase domain-containing protein [Candidatus Uhrbacteria bacterium]
MSPELAFFIMGVQTLLLFCIFGIVFYFSYIMFSLRNELPYVPTAYPVIRRMIATAAIQPHDRVIDLGSGTGRIVLEVARQYPVTVVGVERSKLLLCAARLRQFFTRRKGTVVWEHGDLFTYPLDGTTVVLCFLISSVLLRLAPRFEALPVGARIVSYKFAIPLSLHWQKEKITFGKNDRMHVYRKIS